MTKNKLDIKQLREKIIKGLELSFQKLLKQKQAQNGTFIFSDNGKIKKIKAVDLKN